VTELAQNAVEATPAVHRRRLGWAVDNAPVRAVGGLRLPLGAKLLIGFGIVGALLAAGYILGLVALGQSNSRGEQLLRLQRRAVDLQLVLADSTQLKKAIEFRTNALSNTTLGAPVDLAIVNDFDELCRDSGFDCVSSAPTGSFRLSSVDPKLATRLAGSGPIFYRFFGSAQGAATGSPQSILRRAHALAATAETDLQALARDTKARANALVGANHTSFANSRNLLIGVGAGSLLLALGLGLLLSWSVVAPLRRTEARLDEIAEGDFGGQLDVPNRDEIGSLAAKVNRMSDQLEQLYGELETASRHKSDFLATMSHELRTPLNAIIGFSEVLHEQMFGELNERQLAYVNDVLEAGQHLLSLINDVLDLAKIEAGRLDLQVSQVVIPDVLRGALSMHSERASRGDLELNLTTEPEQITIPADERRLRQIVFNLVSNAVKFTPAGGRVDVSARLKDGEVEIAVADTGPGIAAGDLEAIFKEFEQTSEGKQLEGTGLGLPLSRKLAELHGGRLWAESRPGHGSTFHLILPIAQEVS
jgi:signal transduction histidine kinase